MTEKHIVEYVKGHKHLTALAALLFLTFLLLVVAVGTNGWVIANVVTNAGVTGSSLTTKFQLGLEHISNGHASSPMVCPTVHVTTLITTANAQAQYLSGSCRELQSASSATLAMYVLAILCCVAAGAVVARYIMKGKPLEGYRVRLAAHALFACMSLFAVIGVVVYGASHKKAADYFTLLFNPTGSFFNIVVVADVRLGASYFTALAGTVLALASSVLYTYIVRHPSSPNIKATAHNATGAAALESGKGSTVHVTATPATIQNSNRPDTPNGEWVAATPGAATVQLMQPGAAPAQTGPGGVYVAAPPPVTPAMIAPGTNAIQNTRMYVASSETGPAAVAAPTVAAARMVASTQNGMIGYTEAAPTVSPESDSRWK